MIIVKIGGGAAINIRGIVKDLAELKEPLLIVHGANALRDEIAEKLGTPKEVVTSVSGYSSVLSDEKLIDLMMMSYAGLRNKRLVELCQQNGINAVGLSGLDGRMIKGKRNRGIKVERDGKKLLLKDFSGKPQSINVTLLKLLFENGYTPVLCVPIIDENGYAINSENDDIVALLQRELQAEKIVQCIEAPGFLEDPKDEGSLVQRIEKETLPDREAQVAGRMKRKMLALRKLFEFGTGQVIICDGRIDNPIEAALRGGGTVIE